MGFGRRVASEPANEKELEPWVSDKKKKTLFLAFSSLLRNDMAEIEFLRSCGVKTEEELKDPCQSRTLILRQFIWILYSHNY